MRATDGRQSSQGRFEDSQALSSPSIAHGDVSGGVSGRKATASVVATIEDYSVDSSEGWAKLKKCRTRQMVRKLGCPRRLDLCTMGSLFPIE